MFRMGDTGGGGGGSSPSSLAGFLQIKTADPGAPVNDTAWLFRTGSGPYDVSLKVRIAGVTTEFPLGTTA